MKSKNQAAEQFQYLLKDETSDFVVDEVYLKPEFVDIANAEYSYFILRKENISTFDVVKEISVGFQLPLADIGFSGLKDEKAITSQIISVKKILSKSDEQCLNKYLTSKSINASIAFIDYGGDSIVPRMLHGNHFCITVKGLEPSLVDSVDEKFQGNRLFHFINYYDDQRFGLPESNYNTAEIGKAIVLKDYELAYKEYIRSGITSEQLQEVEKFLKRAGSNYKLALSSLGKNKLNFFISSYNSYLWNTEVASILYETEGHIISEFPNIGYLPLLINTNAPLKGSVNTDAFVHDFDLEETYKEIKIRSIRVSTNIFVLKTADERQIKLSFYLPTGCYATMLIKQLLIEAKLSQK